MMKILLSLIMDFFKDLFYSENLEGILHYKFAIYIYIKWNERSNIDLLFFFYRFEFD